MVIISTQSTPRTARLAPIAASPTPDVRCSSYLERIAQRLTTRRPPVPPFPDSIRPDATPENTEIGEAHDSTGGIIEPQKKRSRPNNTAQSRPSGTRQSNARRKAIPKSRGKAGSSQVQVNEVSAVPMKQVMKKK